jgi:hypothetical protein
MFESGPQAELGGKISVPQRELGNAKVGDLYGWRIFNQRLPAESFRRQSRVYRRLPMTRSSIRKRLIKSKYNLSAPMTALLRSISSFSKPMLAICFRV